MDAEVGVKDENGLSDDGYRGGGESTFTVYHRPRSWSSSILLEVSWSSYILPDRKE